MHCVSTCFEPNSPASVPVGLLRPNDPAMQCDREALICLSPALIPYLVSSSIRRESHEAHSMSVSIIWLYRDQRHFLRNARNPSHC